MSKKSGTKMPASVERIIESPFEEEKAEIAIEGADDLYREIRIENALTDESGNKVRLKPGAAVEITVEAEPNATLPAKAIAEGKRAGKQ